MTTIKSYTDIEQSKKLAKILPIESADMYYWCADHYPKEDWIIEVGTPDDNYECICAWSLAALLNVLLEYHLSSPNPLSSMHCCRVNDIETYANNQVDACYDLILKLNELKML
jgi:hypothetical protein